MTDSKLAANTVLTGIWHCVLASVAAGLAASVVLGAAVLTLALGS